MRLPASGVPVMTAKTVLNDVPGCTVESMIGCPVPMIVHHAVLPIRGHAGEVVGATGSPSCVVYVRVSELPGDCRKSGSGVA